MTAVLLFLFLTVFTKCHTASSFHSARSVSCNGFPQNFYPFCDDTLTPEERATDLVSRLSVDELVSQANARAGPIDRLGIKEYNWRSNCLHGWALSGGQWPEGISWTNFPMPLGLGASFNPSLVNQVAQVTSDEGRALHNIMLTQFNGSSTEAAGLNCFSPMINIFRDPRWGRGKETFSEDPYHISLMGVAYTRGLQEGEDSKYVKIAACAKHYAVHCGPGNIRNRFTANVSLHDLYDTFLPAFKSQALAANVLQIMTALSGTRTILNEDGAPDSANKYLIQTILREEFGMANVSVISDNGAVAQVDTIHHFVSNLTEAAAVCMNAGTDIDLYSVAYAQYLSKAINDGTVSLDILKDAVWRSFYLRILVGDFDPYESVAYQQIDASHLDTPANQKINLQSVRESIVLLKNAQDALPLDPSKNKKIAVIGPLANNTDDLLGNYVGIPSKIISVLNGLEAYNSKHLNGSIEFEYAAGCMSVPCPNATGFDEAAFLTDWADTVIAVMGLDDTLEGEGHDRKPTSCTEDSNPIDVLNLPGCQSHLINRLSASKKNIILVLMNGGPLTIPDLYSSDNIVGILETFYGGSLAGTGIAEVLFGSYNPAGRMPVTTLLSSSDVRDSVDYRMSPSPGRTYRYFSGKTLFPFGYGLSYTQFKYSDLKLKSDTIKPCDGVSVTVVVTNTGSRDGDEVVQVYLIPPEIKGITVPLQELVQFSRIYIKSGSKASPTLAVSSYMLSLVDIKGDRYIYPGEYQLSVGGSSPGESVAIKTSENIVINFTISGTKPVPVNDCGNEAPKCMACAKPKDSQ